MRYNRTDPLKPETVDARDVKLTASEAVAVAANLKLWPGGMGEVLIPAPERKRGWRRDPSFKHHDRRYRPPADALLCPVMLLKQLRSWPTGDYGLHLSAWRSLRDACAAQLKCTLAEAHLLYNEHLRTDPKHLGEVLRVYASLNRMPS